MSEEQIALLKEFTETAKALTARCEVIHSLCAPEEPEFPPNTLGVKLNWKERLVSTLEELTLEVKKLRKATQYNAAWRLVPPPPQ